MASDLFSSSRDPSSIQTVSELISGLSALIESEYADVWVEGELSNFSRAASGHCYFTLKDSEAQIRCVMWRHRTKYIFFEPEDGLLVRVHGDASIYERRGDLQIVARAMRRAGKGAMQEAFEELKRKLDAEGLFDPARKQSLPGFPDTIGVVTSGVGAALQDILSVLERRFPAMEVVLCPVPVQGPDAPQVIAEAIETFNAMPADDDRYPDVLIIGRGGGSVEDLWAFNEEVVARAIARSSLPVISAVGHETDISIADFVADERAATPSMAAEIAVPNRHDLEAHIRNLHTRVHDRVTNILREARQRVEHLTASRAFHQPVHRLQQRRQELDALIGRLQQSGRRVLEQHRHRLDRLRDRLRAADPEAPLRRGYTLVERDGTALSRARLLNADDVVTLRFFDGSREARIESSDTATEN